MTLFNKNNNKNYTFLYPEKCEDRLAYFIYRNVVPRYFKKVIRQKY